MSIACVIFDLDGTLADTPVAIARTIVAAVACVGYPAPSLDAAMATVGRPLDETFERLLPREARQQIPDCVAAYRDLYDRTVVPATRLYPDVPETLAACHAAGIRLAVATTKLTRIAEGTLDRCGVLGYFAAVLGGDLASKPKPDPEIARLALARMGHAPEDALVVGDTTYDLRMGRAAGTFTCAVTYGAHSRARLEDARPDYVIDRFVDLAGILGLPLKP